MMQHGIYYAYWEREWTGDYKHYIQKVAKLGFDILEIAAGPLPDYTEEELIDLRKCAQDNGIRLTVGYGPLRENNIASAGRCGNMLWIFTRICFREWKNWAQH